jgi:5-methylcytosine-specific restriction enzyme subunit McrC
MRLSWQISKKTDAIDSIMPSMKTDIFLENKETKHQTIIDTKFTGIVCSGWYRDETLKSGYLYQMYAYLRTQEKKDDPISLRSTGILLHPAIDCMFDEAIVLDGHCMRFLTVDLTGTAKEIRSDLLKCTVNYSF